MQIVLNSKTGRKEWCFSSEETALLFKVVLNHYSRWDQIIESTEDGRLSSSYYDDIEKISEFFKNLQEYAEGGHHTELPISREAAAFLIEAFNYECAQKTLNNANQDPSIEYEALRTMRDEILAYAHEIHGDEVFRRAYRQRV